MWLRFRESGDQGGDRKKLIRLKEELEGGLDHAYGAAQAEWISFKHIYVMRGSGSAGRSRCIRSLRGGARGPIRFGGLTRSCALRAQ